MPDAVPEIGAHIPVTYVPFRNAHFLSAAVSWAEVLGAERIYIGAVQQDMLGLSGLPSGVLSGVQ